MIRYVVIVSQDSLFERIRYEPHISKKVTFSIKSAKIYLFTRKYKNIFQNIIFETSVLSNITIRFFERVYF